MMEEEVAPRLEEDEDDVSSVSSGSSYDLTNMELTDILKMEIEAGEYTCLICTGEIGVQSKVWSCSTCWRVYDVECVSDWSLRALKDTKNMVDGKRSWKCPSCNTGYFDPVVDYRCWCGKVKDPVYNGLMPHSCGQTCGVKLDSCGVHGCSSMCHPGPHTECTAIGPAMLCRCGKHRRQWPCVMTPYESGWACQQQCREMLPCGEHPCRQHCHDGLCGKCPELVESTCYCGKSKNVKVACSLRSVGSLSEVSEGDSWIGFFPCGEKCGESYDCGVHKCELKCHTRQTDDHQCPRKPQPEEKCYCGKTTVIEVLGRERETCTEPIPTCTKPCDKKLKCGHGCMSYCHAGECPPCRFVQTVKCACGSQTFDVPCGFQSAGKKPRCKKRCTAMMDCRRHRCTEVCCEHEQKALERERQRKKKLRGNNNSPTDDRVTEPVHQCQMVCNKTLNCGTHQCVMTCHAGACRPCMESSSEDYHCPCGMTTLQAPIRCGSMLPKCRYPCTRTPECGHPAVEHECHSDEVECPKCPYPMEKSCACGRQVIKGVQCHRTNVSCGKQCGKELPCGHICTKVCHDFEKESCVTRCQAACKKQLECGHYDKKPCHHGRECVNLCDEQVIITCPCGHRQQKQRCPRTADWGSLECDDSCAIAERNKRLAEALGIDTNTYQDSRPPHEYNEDLIDVYLADPNFGDMIESQLISFVQNPEGKRVLKFPPMKSFRRMLIHMVAQEFELISQAQDAEPNRNVVVMYPEKGKIPKPSLRQYVKHKK